MSNMSPVQGEAPQDSVQKSFRKAVMRALPGAEYKEFEGQEQGITRAACERWTRGNGAQ